VGFVVARMPPLLRAECKQGEDGVRRRLTPSSGGMPRQAGPELRNATLPHPTGQEP